MKVVDTAVDAFERYIEEQIEAAGQADAPEGSRVFSANNGGFMRPGQLLVSWAVGDRQIQAKYLSGSGGYELTLDTRQESTGTELDVRLPEVSFTRYSFLPDGCDSLLVASEIANRSPHQQALATALDSAPFFRYPLPEYIKDAPPGTGIVGQDEFIELGRFIGAWSLMLRM